MPKKTIYELARELEVAPSTVSKALNNKKGVNDESRKRIIQYAKENGYFPNPTARALKSKKNNTIGILYSEGANVGLEHPFFSSVLQSAKEFFEENGYELIFINPKSNDYSGYKEFCLLRNIAGILIVCVSHKDAFLTELISDSNFKLVATDYIGDNVPTVLSNNVQGVKDLVKYFKKSKFKNVGLVIPTTDVRSFSERYETFIDECKKANINVLKENIIKVEDYSFENARISVCNYLNKTNKIPEAIFALSDIYAAATISAFKEKGYDIPKDCSIVGFDDIELSKYISPSLSTIRQNTKQIGITSAKLLLAQLNDITINEYVVRVPVSLIIRQSSK